MADQRESAHASAPEGAAFLLPFAEATCPFRYAIVVNTLRHLPESQHQRAVQDAVYRLVELAGGTTDIARIVTPLLKGGWRLRTDEALIAMVNGYRNALAARRSRRSSDLILELRERDPTVVNELRRLLAMV
jgi:hypothetical protein